MTAGIAAAPQAVWSSLSQADRDAAYNNNAAVRNSAALIVTRDAKAKAYRAAAPAELDIPYGAGGRQAFDLFPAASSRAPCLVFIHGGYWQRNSREQFAHYAEGARAIGWSAALPGYTLAPEASLTEIVAEIGAALDWLVAEGPRYGIEGPIILAGWSAGAQLAVMNLDHPGIAAGLAISGVFDLAPIRDTFLDGALRLTNDEIRHLSPLRRITSHVPLVIAYGTEELPALVHDSEALHARRAIADASTSLVRMAGADHFTIIEDLCLPDSQLLQAVRALAGKALS